MINTTALKSKTCYIDTGTERGTGFFVAADLILTCRHVVPGKAVGDEVEVRGPDKTPIITHVKAISPECDLMLLITASDDPHDFAQLCDCEVVEGTEWASFGHPDTIDGRDAGLTIRGKISENIIDSSGTLHDLNLTIDPPVLNARYKGLSGSALINDLDKVTALLRFQNPGYLSAVSVRKARPFLEENGALVVDDELSDFTEYLNEAFVSFEAGIQEHCLAKGKIVAGLLTPQKIIETLKSTLFYPDENLDVRQIITRLRQESPMNKRLWIGWIKFLTYISVIRGEYKDVNKITIAIDSAKLSDVLNISLTPFKVNLTVSLNFFFTKNASYIHITSQYLAERSALQSLRDNSCHVFNAMHEDFGERQLTAEQKRNVIPDITMVGDVSSNIPGKIFLGVLSLKLLTREIASSQNIVEASKNLEKLFKDALK